VVAICNNYTTPPSNLIIVPPTSTPNPDANNADPKDGPPCDGPCGGGISHNGPSSGDPVNLATGVESYEPSADIGVYNPTGSSVVFARNYRSDRSLGSTASPGLSAGWGHSYDIFAQQFIQGSWNLITLKEPNGAQETLTPILDSNGNPTGALTAPAGSSYTVAGTPSSTVGQWTMLTLTWKDQTVWQLTPGAGGYVLSRITNRLGQSLTLNWDATRRLTTITDVASGNTLLSLAYDGNGNLSSATDIYGRKIVYTFGSASGVALPCLLSVSRISPTSASSPAARWVYGYTAFSTEPLLTSISVPSAAGIGMATSHINYDTGSASPTLKVLSLIDANGNQRIYTYNSTSTVVQVEDSYNTLAASWTQKFDANGRDSGVTDAAGHSTAIAYGDAANPNLPISITDRDGHQTQYTYDAFGHVLTTLSPRGTLATNAYSYASFALGRLMSVQEGSKGATTFDYYEPSGLIHDVYSPTPGTTGSASVATTSVAYDALGNMLTLTGPGNGTVSSITTTFNYTDDFGDALHGVPALTGQTAAFGQPLTAQDNLGNFSHFRYDAQGHLTTAYNALGNRTDYNYIEAGQTISLAGQIQSVMLPATGQTGAGRGQVQNVYQYPDGPLSATTTLDENGNAIRQVASTYGPEGELLAVTGSTEPVAYTYDALYRVKTLQDAALNTTSYFYTPLGGLAQVVYPGAQATPPAAPLTAGTKDTISFTSYDNDGNPLTRVDGRNQITTYAYADPESQLTDITYPTGTLGPVHLNYDAYGRRGNTAAGASGMTDGTGSQVYIYDDDDNLLSKIVAWAGVTGTRTVSYAYNPDGSEAGMTAGGQPFTYSYDGVGRLKTVLNPSSETTAYGYLANGWMQTKTLPNGIIVTKSYDPMGRVTDLLSKLSTTTLSDFHIPASGGYDGIGNRLSVTTALSGGSPTAYSGTTGYAYDYDQSTNPLLNRSQVTGETSTRSGGFSNVFGYDGSASGGPGNPTSFKGTTKTYNSDNQQTGTGYVYDGQGNPTTYKGVALGFDPESRMTSDRTGSQTDGYDGDGLRAWKQEDTTQTYFLYDGADPVCEFDGTGTLAAVNTFGADGLVSRRTAATSTSVFYLFDEHGNVAQRTSKTGAVTGSDLFDTYGTRSGTASTQPDPFGFEGQAGYYTDTKTGLILCTHRFYDPAQGRFLTRDPLGYEGGINLYGYTANNPVNESDPSGLIPPLALAGGGVVVTGATGGEGLAALGAASWPTALGAVVLAAGYGLGTGATWIGNHIANGFHAQDGLPASPSSEARGKDIPRRQELPVRDGESEPLPRRVFRRCPTRGKAEEKARDNGNGPPVHDKARINDDDEYEPGHYHPTRPNGRGGYEKIPDGVHWQYPPFHLN